MNKLRVAISSPHEKNLYSLLVAKICHEDPEIDVVGVCCLKVFSYKRILFEVRRLGPKLIQKILNKYLFNPQDAHTDSTSALVDIHNLKENSLSSFCKNTHIDLCKISDARSLSKPSIFSKFSILSLAKLSIVTYPSVTKS